MDGTEFKILESRKISNEEHKLITNLLDKYKMDKTNFVNNAKTLVFNKIDIKGKILNGYDSSKNIINYNDKSNLTCELLHVASSNSGKVQGICIRPNKVYPKTIGYGLNEGITDLFLEYATNEEGSFPFEKICAKILEYAYGTNIFNYYFLSDDGEFRHQFNNEFSTFLSNLDDYSNAIMGAKILVLNNQFVPEEAIEVIKVYMDIVIEDLFGVVKDSKKDCTKYLKELLSSETMKPIYDIIGKYEYKGNK